MKCFIKNNLFELYNRFFCIKNLNELKNSSHLIFLTKKCLWSQRHKFSSFLHCFYICYLAATQPIVSHCQGVNLANLMLLTEVCQTKDHFGCYIKFGSSLLSASQKGFGINRRGGGRREVNTFNKITSTNTRLLTRNEVNNWQ